MKEDDIRLLAYYKWEKAGSPICDGTEFWEQAKLELYLKSNNDDLEDFDDQWVSFIGFGEIDYESSEVTTFEIR